MTRAIKKALVLVVGWVFILLGMAGLFLPVLQGILFLMIGLVILSTEYVWAHHLLAKLRARFPKLAETADGAKEKATHWLQRIYRREETK
ncbi:MAG TPA: PGPGW domain-containing protein [Terriglobales bacterium]|nr:PGPGW domain-containing protein [Terriglobales bacterium]